MSVEGMQVKVFELAKDLGLPSLELVDLCKTLKIDVRSHMSELQDPDVKTIRSHLSSQKSAKGAKKDSATKVVRKKAAPAAAPIPATKATKATKTPEVAPVAAATTTAPVVRRRASAAAATPAPAASSTTAVETSAVQPQTPTNASGIDLEQTSFQEEQDQISEDIAVQAEVPQAPIETSEEVVTMVASDEVAFVAETAPQSPAATEEAPIPSATPEAPTAAKTPAKPGVKKEFLSRPAVGIKPVGKTDSVIRRIPTSAAPGSGTIITGRPSISSAPLGSRSPLLGSRAIVAGSQSASGAGYSKIQPQSNAGGGTKLASQRSGILNIVRDSAGKALTAKPAARGAAGPIGKRPGAPGATSSTAPKITPRTDETPFSEDSREKAKRGIKIVDKEALTNLDDYRKKDKIFIAKRKRSSPNRELRATQKTTPGEHKRVLKVPGKISVADLANSMGVKAAEIIKKLMSMGMMVTMNQQLDTDQASLVAMGYGYEVQNVEVLEGDLLTAPVSETAEQDLVLRPPVVTVMGHVDHGKTTLLDAIRSANVAKGEAGGITQHVGAYSVQINNLPITFIDTPGHEAFTSMRARGAKATDIVILVVAADDGVMPQTKEALMHAQAAKVPIIVAVNKIDKPGVNSDRIKQELSEFGLQPESWGGDTIFAEVSALKKTGIKELLEQVLLQAEVLELKANPKMLASGVVIESSLDKGKGPIATLLVQQGTLNVGDTVVVGISSGRVRALTDENGKSVKKVLPGFPAVILGLDSVPDAGAGFNAVEDEQTAQKVLSIRREKQRVDAQKTLSPSNVEDLLKANASGMKELTLIVKTDVAGTGEAVRGQLQKIGDDKTRVKLVMVGTGAISESDVMLAKATGASIIGFNIRPDTKARALAENYGIKIFTFQIIYELVDQVKLLLGGLMAPVMKEKYLGRAEVRQLFVVPKAGTIAGCFVIDGKIQRSAHVRLLREGKIVFTGKLASLKRFKDDAKEVTINYECGMGIENYNDLKIGDLIEAFSMEVQVPVVGEHSPSV